MKIIYKIHPIWGPTNRSSLKIKRTENFTAESFLRQDETATEFVYITTRIATKACGFTTRDTDMESCTIIQVISIWDIGFMTLEKDTEVTSI